MNIEYRVCPVSTELGAARIKPAHICTFACRDFFFYFYFFLLKKLLKPPDANTNVGKLDGTDANEWSLQTSPKSRL